MEIFVKSLLGADPRNVLGHRPSPRPAPSFVARAPVGDIGSSVDGGTGGLRLFCAIVGSLASAAIVWLPAGTWDCNIATADTWA